jgi:acyl-[acyl carrier protein]--UDP-N-acetylglucosamine O-acyltransferase
MENVKIGKNCKVFPGAVIGAIPQDLKFQGENTFVEIGDNNTIRLGTQGTGSGQQNKAFIAGIYNTTPSGGNDGTVIIDSNGQVLSCVKHKSH